ncbi:MAG: hypothetical protein HOE54_08455, partial [Gammaproteobacteria bacterium]|nr:hypothetical protein [Gammaproteobacteria bacterium]
KLFFTHNTGEIASCSGAFAGAQQVIVTAAHCVMNSEGDWNSDFLFIKGYGSPEQEMFAIECIALPEKWGDLQGEASLDFDYAFLRTKRLNQENSWEISDQPPPEKLTIVGYSDKYYDGKHMIEVVVDTLSTLPFRIGSTNNSLGKGSSGSPWFGEKFVHSVSSHYLNKRSDVMWGPRMSDETQSVLAYTQNHCTPSL